MKIKLSKEEFYTNDFLEGDCACCEHFNDLADECEKHIRPYELEICLNWSLKFECDEKVSPEELEDIWKNHWKNCKPEDLLK